MTAERVPLGLYPGQPQPRLYDAVVAQLRAGRDGLEKDTAERLLTG